MSKFNCLFAVCGTSLLLIGCGGGGGGGGGTADLINPLTKYQGTYYVCDGHTKTQSTISVTGTNSISLTFGEEIYQNSNCTGSVIGKFVLPSVYSATYESPVTLSLPKFTIFPDLGAGDKIRVTAPSMTASLTGTGVKGNCVNYFGGSNCYDFGLYATPTDAMSALYLNGDYLITFGQNGNTFVKGNIMSKNPLFNLLQLVGR